jgi:hypothetical protein
MEFLSLQDYGNSDLFSVNPRTPFPEILREDLSQFGRKKKKNYKIETTMKETEEEYSERKFIIFFCQEEEGGNIRWKIYHNR